MIYRGQILLAVTVAFALSGGLASWLFFTSVEEWPEWARFVLFALAATCFIGTLVTAAMAYTLWVPKWERIEKRTGTFPGEIRGK